MQPYHRLSIAPMMAYTDRHFRYLVRQYTRRSLLYTEMVVASTITHNLESGLLDRVLAFDPLEHPIAVQLGGDQPKDLQVAARVCEQRGFDEINLNVGCPSDRVQKGAFGVCLMKEPAHVAELMAAMKEVVRIPVTIKHRIGVDDVDDYDSLAHFVATVAAAGVDVFAVHARKAWLKGLSPAQNRNVPPLKYDFVYRLKQDFPHLSIILNGGVMDLHESSQHLARVDGVMIGRAAYHQPEMFADADQLIFGTEAQAPPSPAQILRVMDDYLHREIERGGRLSFVAKHLVGLFKNRPHSRLWRQKITELIQQKPKDFSLARIYAETFGEEELLKEMGGTGLCS